MVPRLELLRALPTLPHGVGATSVPFLGSLDLIELMALTFRSVGTLPYEATHKGPQAPPRHSHLCTRYRAFAGLGSDNNDVRSLTFTWFE